MNKKQEKALRKKIGKVVTDFAKFSIENTDERQVVLNFYDNLICSLSASFSATALHGVPMGQRPELAIEPWGILAGNIKGPFMDAAMDEIEAYSEVSRDTVH